MGEEVTSLSAKMKSPIQQTLASGWLVQWRRERTTVVAPCSKLSTTTCTTGELALSVTLVRSTLAPATTVTGRVWQSWSSIATPRPHLQQLGGGRSWLPQVRSSPLQRHELQWDNLREECSSWRGRQRSEAPLRGHNESKNNIVHRTNAVDSFDAIWTGCGKSHMDRF